MARASRFRTSALSGSIPSGSDIENFAHLVDDSRERELARYEGSAGESLEESHEHLLAAYESLSIAEEELRAQNEAILEAQRQLEIQRSRYRTLFDFAPDPYIVTDEGGVIEEANAAAADLFGMPAGLLIGKPFAGFVDLAERRQFRTRLLSFLTSDSSDKWTIEARVRDGQSVTVEATVSILENRPEGRKSLCWMLHDMTARRQTEDSMKALNRSLNARVAQRTRELELALAGEHSARREAETANRIKSELFARLSHEFRTPLHAVSGYLEILQQNIHGGLNEEQRKDVDRIHQAQEHLLALVNMILDFAKLEGGPIELSMAEIPIEETLRGAESLLTPQFTKKGVSYTHRNGDPSLSVFADREKVQQIIVNLLANACKFTPSGGSVELDWRIEDETLLVRVRDTGAGIPEDKVEQIFEPFVQLRTPGSMPPGGTGLGLPISRDLARAMGGDVTATSKPGAGSVFSLRLPLRKHVGAGKLSEVNPAD